MSSNWIKPAVIAAAVFVFFAAVAGCNWGDVVRANTPANIQATQQLAPSLPLNDAVYAYEDWLSQTTRDGRRWQSEIEKASNIVSFLDTFTLKAIGELGPQVAGIPVLSALVPAMAGLAGILIKRPGDVTAVANDKTWDEAFAAGKQAALDGVREGKA